MVSPSPILPRVAAGDRAAVEACINEYAGLIQALAVRYLGHAGPDVDDAVQDVFVELWRCAGRFTPGEGSSEAAFIATIAHRRLIDAQRRKASGLRLVAAIESGTHAAPSSTARASDPGVHAEDDLRAAAAALNQLTEPVREAMYLSFFHGLTHSAIAHRTGVPVGTVKTRLRRGLVEVRRAIFGPGAEQGAGTAATGLRRAPNGSDA